MKQFLNPIEKDFNEFKFNHNAYETRVKKLSSDFDLPSGSHLRHDQLPTYWAGDLSSNTDKIAVVGINPKYDESKIAFENKLRLPSWSAYHEFHNNFFLEYKKSESKFHINYYQTLAGALSNKSFDNRSYYDFCHKTLINLDIIPYHSANFNNARLSSSATTFLSKRFFNDLLPFMVRCAHIKKAIIHDKRLTVLLREQGFIGEGNIIYSKKIKGRNGEYIYHKSLDGLELFIFSRFIPVGGFRKEEVYNAVFK